jgi:methyl-accepting chemotaxis protein
MRHWGISTRLWLAVLLVVLSLGAVVGFAALRNKAQQVESAQRMAELDERLSLASEWRRLTDANVVRNLALMLSNDPELQKVFKTESTAVIEQINRLNEQIAALQLSANEKTLLDTVATERAAVLDIRKKILAVRAQSDTAEQATQLLQSQFLPQRDRYVGALSAFVDAQKQAQVALRLELKERSAQTVLYASVAVALVLGLIVLGAAFLIRSIRTPLARSVQIAEAIANGDLTQNIHTTRRDEFGQLMLALAHMNQSLGKLVGQVHQASENIQVASSEVAAGTQDLASRTEAAASNLEETASSMEELTATVKQSADAARQANQLSSTAAEVAARGGQVVQQVVATMQDINQSSQKIADIIGVIDGIAFQTNILALNAAVEAARAGESGRGFAVVASEVRNLAQRSAEAAKEIKALIGTSVEKVQSGSQLVQDAGRTMEDIVASVQRVTDVVGEISAASSEQSDGIAQVNTSINHLDQMTQQNAALVEQSTAAAESLRDQAQRLIEVVGVFKVGSQGHSSSRAPAAAPAIAAKAAAARLSSPERPRLGHA